jgi:hypothetical protein
MSRNFLIGSDYYYFAWGTAEKEDLIDAIKTIPEIKRIVFFGPEEHEFGNLFTGLNEYQSFAKYLNKLGVDHIILTSAIADPNLNSGWPYKGQKKFLSWDSFFAYQVIEYYLVTHNKPFGHNEKIEKHFTSLNARSHNWRCMFVDHMYKEGLFDYGYVSWHNSDNWEYNYKFKYWTPKIINFDENWLNNTDGILDIMLPPEKQFKSSLFSVISESNDRVLKTTEKVYIPIYHKRPFIVYAAPNFHKTLQNQGFVLFDEIFDYSFDRIPNDRYNDGTERCEAMMHETKKITNYDPNDLYKILKPKIEHNYKMLYKLVESQDVHPKVKKLIYKTSLLKADVDYYKRLNLKDHPKFKDFMKE